MRRRVFVTGSTTGLGRAAAAAIIEDGHDVVVHARTAERVTELGPLATQALGVIVGDLADTADVRSIADQANGYGPFDAVIHNAGIYVERTRVPTDEGHPRVLAVNVLAPYTLTALIERPARLIYLTSGMHQGGRPSLDDLDWLTRPWNGTQAYSDSKLLLTTFAARARPPLDRHLRQRCRPRLGPHTDGRTRRNRRPRARPRHPGVARRQRRTRSQRHRPGTGTTSRHRTRRPPYTTPRSRTRSSTNSHGSPGSRSVDRASGALFERRRKASRSFGPGWWATVRHSESDVRYRSAGGRRRRLSAGLGR